MKKIVKSALIASTLIAAGASLRKIWPSGYRFITGGRGF